MVWVVMANIKAHPLWVCTQKLRKIMIYEITYLCRWNQGVYSPSVIFLAQFYRLFLAMFLDKNIIISDFLMTCSGVDDSQYNSLAFFDLLQKTKEAHDL